VTPGRETARRPEAPARRPGTRRFDRRRPVPGATAPLRTPIFDADPAGTLRTRETRTRMALAVADVVAAMLALLILSGFSLGDGAILLAIPVVLVLHKVAGLYDRDGLVLRRSTLDEVPTLLLLSCAFALAVAVAAEVLLQNRLEPVEILALWSVSATVITAGRLAARTVVRRVGPAERCLIIGDDEGVRHVERKLRGAADHGVEVVAALTGSAAVNHGIRHPEDMRALIQQHGIHRVVIAPMSSADSAYTVDLVRIAKAAGARVSILPRVLEAVGSAVEFEQVDGMTMLGVRRFGLSRSSVALKRAFDLVIGSLLLLAAAPLMGVLALAVRLDSKGPVFFRQVRIGRDGTPFRIWKFRSMVADAEALKEALRVHNEAGDGLFKVAEDPRITRVGRFLRRTSLDELPQIFNVVGGDISLVGPRPLVADEDALVEGLYRARLHLTPGMTGPWQILGTTRVPLAEMVAIDYLYVANWSLWADVKLLARTVPHMLLRRGL